MSRHRGFPLFSFVFSLVFALSACNKTGAVPSGNDGGPGALPSEITDNPLAMNAVAVLAAAGTSPSTDGTLHWDYFSCYGDHTFAIKSDGTLWGWGWVPSPDQLKWVRMATPARIGDKSDWKKVSKHMGLRADGTLWAWAENYFGLLGTSGLPRTSNGGPYNEGAISACTWPIFYGMTQVGTESDWADVSSGGNHAVAIKRDGSLWAWGDPFGAALGDGRVIIDGWNPEMIQYTPLRIGGDNDWAQVSAESGHTLALKSDGSLWWWGYQFWDEGAPFPTSVEEFRGASIPSRIGSGAGRFTFVAAGEENVFAIHEDGSLWGWGGNRWAELGNGNANPVAALTRLNDGPWKRVAAGYYHTLGVRTDGTLWAWGDNCSGELGIGTLVPSLVPARVGQASDWEEVSCGDMFSAALKGKNPDGKLWLWGNNEMGQLGNGITGWTDSPGQVGKDSDWSRVEIGAGRTVALKKDGSLWSWGSNSYGELGDGTVIWRQAPARVGAGGDWADFALGGGFTLGVKKDGSLWSWGDNSKGQLGDGTTTSCALPVRVGTGSWKTAFAGWESAFAIRSDGSLWAWGCDSYGNLGLGGSYSPPNTFVPQMVHPTPARVGTASNWKAGWADQLRTLVLKEDGTLWSVGAGEFAPLGNGTRGEFNLLVPVGGSGWTEAGLGATCAFALKEGGALWGWGVNEVGQMGAGNFVDRLYPAPVDAGPWLDVAAAGSDRIFALKADGTIWGWGGVVPWPETMARWLSGGSNIPVPCDWGGGWASLSGGGFNLAGIRADGTLWTWGSNVSGQLGNSLAWCPFPIWIP